MDKKRKTEQTVGPPKMVTITLRVNRKYDLHIGREIKTFLARETKSIPEKWLKHPDWHQASKLFMVKGV